MSGGGVSGMSSISGGIRGSGNIGRDNNRGMQGGVVGNSVSNVVASSNKNVNANIGSIVNRGPINLPSVSVNTNQ